MRPLLVLLLSLSLILASCSSNEDDSGQPPQNTSTAEAGSPPGSEIGSICGGESLEGCFALEEMHVYLEAVLPMIEQYFAAEFAELAPPRDVIYVPNSYAARSACGVSNSFAYEYCVADQTIYIGQDLLWEFYDRTGDAAPAVGLAHEWGHHLQVSSGIFPKTREEAIAFENQADCISGAWARYAEEQGWLETDDDLEDVRLLLEAIASAEGPTRDHGTAEERERAFKTGFERGVAACEDYV